MKKIYPILLLIVIAYILNGIYLKISWLQFTGIIASVLLIGGVLLVLFFKFINRKKEDVGEKYSYAFPDPMAKFMKLVDQRTQYESALLSMFFMMIGMIIFTIYIVAFTEYSLWFKGMLAFNSFWGIILMISFMVTQYQAYVNYMMIAEEINKSTDLLKGGKLKKNGKI